MNPFTDTSQVTAVVPTWGDDPWLSDRLENILEQSRRPSQTLIIAWGASCHRVPPAQYRRFVRTVHVADYYDLAELAVRTPYTVVINPGEWLTATAFEAMELAMDIHPECSAGQANRLITTVSGEITQETFSPYFGALAKENTAHDLKTPTAIFRVGQGWTANWNGTRLEIFNEGNDPSIYGIPVPLGHCYESKVGPAPVLTKGQRTRANWSIHCSAKIRRPL